jgi:hypothetical protein
VLGGDPRAQVIPQRHVGALELVLGGQHVGRQRGRVVADDLDRGEHVQRLERRHQIAGVGEGGDQMAAEVEDGPDVAGADLVGQHGARPLSEEGVGLGPGGRTGAERAPLRR